jgi:CBS domain-containing protein
VTGRGKAVRNLPVSACVGRLSIDPLLVHPGDDVFEVLRRASEQPQTRVLGVVDDDGRLVGILPILRLAEAVIGRLTPELLMADLTDLDEVARFGQAIETRTAADAMLAPASVTPTSSISEAFRLMHDGRLSGVYVVDAARRPTGYVDLLELARVYVDELQPDAADEVIRWPWDEPTERPSSESDLETTD